MSCSKYFLYRKITKNELVVYISLYLKHNCQLCQKQIFYNLNQLNSFIKAIYGKNLRGGMWILEIIWRKLQKKLNISFKY